MAGHGGTDLLDVDHEALAEHRVERVLEPRDPARVVLDGPAEEVVVLAYRGRVVADAVRALQPPVRGVQCVRVVRAAQKRARASQRLLELVLTEDPNVTAWRVVVLV